ncbi:MAG: DUF5818 domain-containing protein [Candidatus Acidiferrales bacterium]
MMKKTNLRLFVTRASLAAGAAMAAMLLAGVLATTAAATPAGTSTLTGEISDSQCATNVHSATRSHQEMLKGQNMGGTSADCARLCVKDMGGNYVLLVKEKVYKLDDQELAEKYAGAKVKVTGTVDAEGKTIHVKSMEPAS